MNISCCSHQFKYTVKCTVHDTHGAFKAIYIAKPNGILKRFTLTKENCFPSSIRRMIYFFWVGVSFLLFYILLAQLLWLFC